jgi:hypothetical protein
MRTSPRATCVHGRSVSQSSHTWFADDERGWWRGRRHFITINNGGKAARAVELAWKLAQPAGFDDAIGHSAILGFNMLQCLARFDLPWFHGCLLLGITTARYN